MHRKIFTTVALTIGLTVAGNAFAQEVVIAMMPAGMDTYGSAVARGFSEEATALGARAIIVDSKWSVENMSNGVDDLISQKVNGIAMAPIDAVGAVAWVEKLNEAKIPVVAVSTGVGDPTKGTPKDVYPGLFALVNHDDVEAGAMSAGILIPRMSKDKTTKIALVSGAPGYAVNDQRRKGFIDALDAAGANYEIVADQPTDWTAETAESVCQNILTANSDLDVIFAFADGLALGCGHAVQTTGSKALVLSTTGGMKLGNDAIASGEILGSTCVKPETMGRLAAKALFEAATNPDAEAGKFVTYDHFAVTKDNLDKCAPEW